MRTHRLGKSDLVVSRMSFGNMRSVGVWNPADVKPEHRERGVRAHIAAYEAGYTLFDTADIYSRGTSEEVLGQTLRQVSGMRQQIVIATKCGIRFGGDPTPASPHRYDFSKEHILRSCDLSLARMGIETIDLYQLHRPDLLMNPPEIADAFEQLHRAGKVRYFGVSNFSPSFVACLQAHLKHHLIVNQVEIHLGRLDCFYDGTLDQCIERNMTPLAWSPLAGGWLGTGREPGLNDPNYAQKKLVLSVLDEVSRELGVSRTVAALAWLMKHPSQINPIVGSANPNNIREATRADGLEMSRDQWYRILVAARGKALP